MMPWRVEVAEAEAFVVAVADFTAAVREAAARTPDESAAVDTGMPEERVRAIRLQVAPVLVDRAIP